MQVRVSPEQRKRIERAKLERQQERAIEPVLKSQDDAARQFSAALALIKQAIDDNQKSILDAGKESTALVEELSASRVELIQALKLQQAQNTVAMSDMLKSFSQSMDASIKALADTVNKIPKPHQGMKIKTMRDKDGNLEAEVTFV